MITHRVMFAFVVALAVALSSVVQPVLAQGASRPNIIYIMADDLGWKDVGFHGSDIKTPSIDQLAQTGATLEQFYTQAMCTQTRAALMTGRYPLRYGLQTAVIPATMTYGLSKDEYLLPQALKSAGYTTAIMGKWHLGHGSRDMWPMQRGFDYQYGGQVGEVDYFTRKTGGKTDWYRNNRVLNEKGYVTTLIGDDAVRFIKQQDKQKPFFLYLAFTAPHAPFQAPQEYIDRYKNIPDMNRRIYAAMITALDDQIGRVSEALRQRGMSENTVIVFHSDNGGNHHADLGESVVSGKLPANNGPFRGGKSDMYEGGNRVVSLINWPGKIKPGSKVNEMIHVVDYYPTLAKLAGASFAKAKAPLDGLDVWPAIADGKSSGRNEIVYNVEMFRAALRQGDWKLVWRTVLPAKIELFNLAKDPSETTNVAEQNPQIVADLQKRIGELAVQSQPSLLVTELFQGAKKANMGGPPALPNDDAFYQQAD